MKKLISILIAVMVVGLAGCGTTAKQEIKPEGKYTVAEMSMNGEVFVSEEDIAEMVEAGQEVPGLVFNEDGTANLMGEGDMNYTINGDIITFEFGEDFEEGLAMEGKFDGDTITATITYTQGDDVQTSAYVFKK